MGAPRFKTGALGVGALAAIVVVALGQLSGTTTVSAAPESQSARAKAPVAADHPQVAPPVEAAGVWTDAEIISGLEECVRLLAPTGAEVELSKPIRNGQCGTPAPVLLKRIDGVELSPPALVNCRIAAKVHTWIKERLQPLALEVLGTPVARLNTASAYMCRQRIGSSSDKLSEHSFANALDISAFVMMDGRSIDVLTRWGPTARDRQAQIMANAVGGGDAGPLRDVGPPGSTAQEAQFLRKVHEGACGMFGTVLGPEANEAHRNHLHLDLAARKRSAFCE